jgi:hypothetical protein
MQDSQYLSVGQISASVVGHWILSFNPSYFQVTQIEFLKSSDLTQLVNTETRKCKKKKLK